MNSVVAVQNVKKHYHRRTVLDGVDWQIEPGSVVGLLGVNGAGKTTLLNTLVGIVVPDSGDVQVFDQNPRHFSVPVKQRIGYVPQTTDDFSWMRVEELLKFTASFYANWDHDKIESLRQRWRLDSNAKIGTLSVGQRQRVSILRALGHNPDLLILDEPVASLDPAGRRDFLREVLELSFQGDKTVIFATHITSDLERVATHTSILHNGRIALHQDLDTIKEQVVKLVIQSKRDLPPALGIANPVNTHIDGQRAVITVQGLEPGTTTRLEQELAATVTQHSMNLEDIFLELTS